MEKPRKILIVSHYYAPHIGGEEVIAQMQANFLTQQGFEVTVVSSRHDPQLPAVADEQGVKVNRVKILNVFEKRGIPFPIFYPQIFPVMWRAVGAAEIVHIHDVFYISSWVAALMAFLRRKPLFLTQHVALVNYPHALVMLIEKIIYHTIGRIIFNQARTILVFYQQVKNNLFAFGAPPEKILELGSGVDFMKFHPVASAEEKKAIRRKLGLPVDKPLALFLGRLVPKKGFREFCEMQSENFDLMMVSSDDLAEPWKSMAHMHFLGKLTGEPLADAYRAADAYVFPSHGEVFPLAVQEALASGLPIITSPENTYRDYGMDERLFLRVEPQTLALKSAMDRVATDSEFRQRMSDYSLKVARKYFDWNANMRQAMEMYQEVLHPNTEAIGGKGVVVTTSWDDGHRLDLKMAKLLKKYHLPGTFYVAPRNREFSAQDLLNEAEVKALAQEFEIGGHTLTHPRLATLVPAGAEAEIVAGKKHLENWVGKEIQSFCYPGGNYTQTNLRQVREAGFVMARTVERYAFFTGNKPYEMATTLHAYDHWLDLWQIFKFVKFNPFTFLKVFRRWDLIAMMMFDRVCREGGMFHLWGHSWEIDQNGDWDRLERVFKYISGKAEVSYVNNSELV